MKMPLRLATLARPSQRGFTLIEMIMVIVLIGIIGSIVAVFMKSPVDAYFASARRAAITDTADTVLRRMARDLHRALPNSVRVPNNQCMEFIPTKTGGRYRADGTAAALDFDVADTSFNMLGSNSALPVNQRIVSGDLIAVYNLESSGTSSGANAYNGDNTSIVSSTPTESGIPIEASISISAKRFPFQSDSNRFQVIDANEKVVAYVCSAGTLFRTVNASSFVSSCPATGAVFASNVRSCTFKYDTGTAVAYMTLVLSDKGESVTLTHLVHIENQP